MYGENFIERSKARCAAIATGTERLKVAFEQQQQAEAAEFKKLAEEARLRQIEMYRKMAESSNNPTVQELCNKELARLEAETTGA